MYCNLGTVAAVETTAFWRCPGRSVWEAAGLRCVKQVGGIPKAGLEAVVCAAKEVNQKNSDGQSLLEFSGLSWSPSVFLSVTFTFQNLIFEDF